MNAMNHDTKMALVDKCAGYKFKYQLKKDLEVFFKENPDVQASVVLMIFSNNTKYNVV